jgi:chemotaxis protein MotB
MPLIDLTKPSEAEQKEAMDKLESGEWQQNKPEPAPGELKW